ncbi:MAG: PGPGW domain-containing protein [Candidatus Saccharimonadales bacterium]
MKYLAKFARQILVAVIGFPLLIIGIILIPLPGPGILICFIALFILSWGFDWAEKYLEKCKDVFRTIYEKAKERAEKIEKR